MFELVYCDVAGKTWVEESDSMEELARRAKFYVIEGLSVWHEIRVSNDIGWRTPTQELWVALDPDEDELRRMDPKADEETADLRPTVDEWSGPARF